MTNAYAQFVSEPIKYSICRYGDSEALALRGPPEYIALAHNLFSNLKGPTRLTWVRDAQSADPLAYITCSLPRIKATVKLYLYLRILMGKEVESRETFDEETGEYTLIRDEARANELAEADAMHFMAALPTESFLPRAGSRG